MPNSPEDQPNGKGIGKIFSALHRAPFNILIIPIGITAGLIGIAAAVLMPFWQSLVIIGLLILLISRLYGIAFRSHTDFL